MPDQIDAEIPQVLDRQAGQQARVDLIRTKRRRVLFEPEATEPCSNVHDRFPNAVKFSRPPPRHGERTCDKLGFASRNVEV